MAIPILNHLDLNSTSEIQNAILHKTTSGTASDIEGKIIYDTGTDTIKYYSGTSGAGSWVSLTASSSVTVSDNSGSTAMPVVFHDESNNLHDDTGAFTYKPSTGEVIATTFTGALTGNVTGNASGTALTVTQAAQTAITSLGTLTALTVDDVAIDGKVITMTGSSGDTATLTAGTNGTLAITTTDAAAAAANITITADGTFEAVGTTITLDSAGAINLEPAAGSAVLIDGNVSIDGSVVTGASSITSTAFVGALTGNADTATLATNSTHVLVTDNESTDEENAITFVEGATKNSSGQVGLESDGTLTYNPSSGTVTATTFVGNVTGDVTGDLTIGGHTVDDIDIGSEFVDADDHLMSSGAIKEKIEGYSYITASSSDTLSNKTIAASQVTEISNLSAVEGAQLENIDSTTISATQWGYLGAASGAITNTDVDVSKANLQAALASLDGTDTTYIGDAGDDTTVVIRGTLQVDGSTTTVDSTTVTLNDHNIVLDTGNSTSAVVDGAGWTLEGGSGDDVTWMWDASATAMVLKLGSSLGDVGFGTIELGHATDTTIARSGSGDITIEGNAVYRAGGTDVPVADGGTGASTLTDGGVLLGSGTGAITAMAVLADGEMIVGDGTTDPVAESGATLRTSIGVGTGDSPQFTGVNVGHASDTTLTRASAGVLAVEGANVYTVGGTDVAIADGGTGAGTALAGFNALKQAATDSYTGVVELATADEVIAGTDTSRVPTVDTLAAKSVVALIDVSELDGTVLAARIEHSLNTKNLLVTAQLKGAGTDNQYCIIDWECTTDGSTDSSDDIYVKFSAEPSSDVVVNISSIAGGTAVTPTYPS